jgi:hypothetical protein
LNHFPDSKGQQGDLKGTEPSRPGKNTYGEFKIRACTPKRGDSGSAARFFYCAKASATDRNEGCDDDLYWLMVEQEFHQITQFQYREYEIENKEEGAHHQLSRGNIHPTVKPNSLMRYLIRLVTPPGGRVLDPFVGSGSSGKASVQEGFGFIGIDMVEAHVIISVHRLMYAIQEKIQKDMIVTTDDR